MLFPRNMWFAISTEHVICHFHGTRDSLFPRNAWSSIFHGKCGWLFSRNMWFAISTEHVIRYFRGTRDPPFSMENVVDHFRRTCDPPFPWTHAIYHFRPLITQLLDTCVHGIVQALGFLRSEQNSFQIVSVNLFIEERAWKYVPSF
jgi:hypothetical protein